MSCPRAPPPAWRCRRNAGQRQNVGIAAENLGQLAPLDDGGNPQIDTEKEEVLALESLHLPVDVEGMGRRAPRRGQGKESFVRSEVSKETSKSGGILSEQQLTGIVKTGVLQGCRSRTFNSFMAFTSLTTCTQEVFMKTKVFPEIISNFFTGR